MFPIRTNNIDWTRLSLVFGFLIVLWTGLVTLLPPGLYEPVSVVLVAIQSALLYLMRAGKSPTNPSNPPQGGVQ